VSLKGSCRVHAKRAKETSGWLKNGVRRCRAWWRKNETRTEDLEASVRIFYFYQCQETVFCCQSKARLPPLWKHWKRKQKHNEEARGEKVPQSGDGRLLHTSPITTGDISVGARRRRGLAEEKSLTHWVASERKKKKWTEKERLSERRRREKPPDRRSSGKQKRLHTLLCLICLRVLSTTGSVSVTPFAPSLPPCRSLSFHLIPPSPSPPLLPPLFLPLPPLCCLPRTPLSGPGLTSGGPAGAGGPETEADSEAEAASTQAVGTTGPAHLDPVASHVHHRNTPRGEDVRLIHESTHTFLVTLGRVSKVKKHTHRYNHV